MLIKLLEVPLVTIPKVYRLNQDCNPLQRGPFSSPLYLLLQISIRHVKGSQTWINRLKIKIQDKSIWLKFRLPFIGELRFNPVVSFFSIFLIWGFVIWCILLREDVPFNKWRTWIVEHLTWLYMGTLVSCEILLSWSYFNDKCTLQSAYSSQCYESFPGLYLKAPFF